jgi:hypothetical protein
MILHLWPLLYPAKRELTRRRMRFFLRWKKDLHNKDKFR